MGDTVEDLVTKDYLRAEMEALERRLTVAMYRALLVQTAAILGAVFALLRLVP